MKIKLPKTAVARDAVVVPNRTIVKIDGMEGWDIVNAIAKENGIGVKALFMATSAGIYCDHIMVDTSSLDK
jgi:hypothetical protein